MGLACRRGCVRHDTGTFSMQPQSGRHMNIASRNSTHPDIAQALRECRRAFGSVALFSGVVNLLMLAGPLYMLQIYDRRRHAQSRRSQQSHLGFEVQRNDAPATACLVRINSNSIRLR